MTADDFDSKSPAAGAKKKEKFDKEEKDLEDIERPKSGAHVDDMDFYDHYRSEKRPDSRSPLNSSNRVSTSKDEWHSWQYRNAHRTTDFDEHHFENESQPRSKKLPVDSADTYDDRRELFRQQRERLPPMTYRGEVPANDIDHFDDAWNQHVDDYRTSYPRHRYQHPGDEADHYDVP